MRADNKEIFKTRFQKHYPRLCNIAYGYVSDKEDSEDIVQELFVYVWNKGLDSMAEPEFAAYMTTAVKNRSISFLRKRTYKMVPIDCRNASSHNISDEDSADNHNTSTEEKIESALSVLPPRCKDIFMMAKMHGMKYREIASALNLSEKTIENQMTKAIRLLRTYVAENRFVMATVIIIILSQIINHE